MRCLKSGLMLLCFSGRALVGTAQNMTAPYSVYGIGEIEQQGPNNNGMGFTGIGIKSSYYTNGNNPASVSGLPTSLLLFQVSGSARRVNYLGDPISSDNSKAKDFSFKSLSVTAKLNNFWGSSVGFRQLSYVGYQFAATKQVDGAAETYPLQYSGDGGLYDFYWNNAFSIGRHFSVGATGSFIAGPINQTENSIDESGNLFSVKRRDYYGNFRLQTGALYTADLNKKWSLGLGVQYAPKSPLNFERTYSLSQNDMALLTDTAFSFHKKKLPASWGAGISLSSKEGTTWAADYTSDSWSDMNVKGTGWRLTNSSRASAGVSFARENKQFMKSVVRKSFQFGGFYQRNYQQVAGRQLDGYGVTAGLSRLLKSGFMYELGLEAGSRGTIKNGLIKENYIKLSVQLSYRDIMLTNMRRYD